MEELLSLKWNNHKNSFLQLLSILRKKNTYTDVTLACDGKLYNVHKMVLSACSDYFSNIFENITCANPVIILKDMPANNLESLLDYMYLGEVSVRQADLASLIQAAECLKLKGLAVPDTEFPDQRESRKRSADPSPNLKKKSKKTFSETIPCPSKNSVNEFPDEPPINKLPPSKIESSLKTEEEIVTIKEEKHEPLPPETEYTETWDFTPDLDTGNFDESQQEFKNTSEYAIPPSFTSPETIEESYNEGDLSNNETSSFDSSIPSSSHQFGNITINPFNYFGQNPFFRRNCCIYCTRCFHKRETLERHIRIHTGEKPFACSYCPFRTNRQFSLTKHNFSKHRAMK